MKTNLKENIWINGFDHDFKPHQFWFSKMHEIKETIYLGKTSEIPEEIAKKCVENIELFDGHQSIGTWYFCIDDRYPTALELIQSLCNQEHCIIYKL